MLNSKSNGLSPKLFSFHYNDCDPKKCTVIKLNRLNLLKIIKTSKIKQEKSIILNPFAHKLISINDRDRILKYGLCVIDCSWKKLLKIARLDSSNFRKLPRFIATNPTNFGKWEKLSSVEAIAASLYITNFPRLADLILSKFSWGIQFKELNKF